jgi:hypothetical protein
MNARVRGVLIAAALLAAAGLSVARRSSNRRPQGAEPKIPALAADEDEGLTFPVETTRTTDPVGRRLRIRIGGGEVALTLADTPAGSRDSNGIAFGTGVLEAADRARGNGVLEAIAGWLQEKVPPAPTRPGSLAPFQLSYVSLGTDGSWEANKLFFEDGAENAEIFLNLRKDGAQARLLEKDDSYRKPLLAILARAIRDGRPPRRTPANDPTFSSAVPVVASLAPLIGGKDAGKPETWIGHALAATTKVAPAKVLLWDDLGKPPRSLVELPGRISALVVSPKADRLAAMVVHPKDNVGMSSDDPGEVVVVALSDGAKRSLVTSSEQFQFGFLSTLVWAPDGRALAIGGHGTGKPARQVTRVYDLAAGKATYVSSPELDAGPVRWDASGLTLAAWIVGKGGTSGDDMERKLWLWRPGQRDPAAVPSEASKLRTPDGTMTVNVAPTALTIESPKGRRRFTPGNPQDLSSLESLAEDPSMASWLGPSALVLASDADVVLDLQTAKLRYLFPEGETQFVSASPDGRHVVAQDPQGKLLWGTSAIDGR